MKAFHSYDIRGIYNVDFNKEDVYAIGFYLPRLLNVEKVLVGRDVRKSSPEIYKYLLKGITDSGCDVYDIGLSTTPMVYWTTAKFKFDASVMITASHNPKEYNGMKISQTDALPVGYDTGLNKLEKMLLSKQDIIPSTKRGSVIEFNIRKDYQEFLKTYVSDFSELKIALDCSNGMAALLIKEILGDIPEYIYEDLDGSFPNHEPNPLDLKNVRDLQSKVNEINADIGIIFDGDADRVMFTDERGEFISPDLIIALLGHYFFEKQGLKGKVLQDIRTSKSVGEYLSKWDCEIETWRVGRAYASIKLREIDGIFGGELAGHYYFKEFYYSDSGILACLLILDVLKKFKNSGKKLSEVIDNIKTYENSGEINFQIENKLEAMDAVRKIVCSKEKPIAFFDFDGYRIEFKDWWFNIRPSNTEPYLRLLVEARNTKLLEEKTELIKSIISVCP